MRLLVVLFVIVFLSSCSIEKRIYRPGFHIESNLFQRQGSMAQRTSEINKVLPKSDISIDLFETKVSYELKTNSLSLLQRPIADGDTLLLNDDGKISKKAEDNSEFEFVYTAYDQLEGPSFKERLYKKGHTDINEGKKELEPFGLASLITTVSSFLLAPVLLGIATYLFFTGFVLAIISLVIFGVSPGKYRGKWMPLAVMILWGLMMITILVYLGFLIAQI